LLDRSKTYSIEKNGQTIGSLDKGIFKPRGGTKGIGFNPEGVLEISTGMAGTQTFLIQAEK